MFLADPNIIYFKIFITIIFIKIYSDCHSIFILHRFVNMNIRLIDYDGDHESNFQLLDFKFLPKLQSIFPDRNQKSSFVDILLCTLAL